MSKAFVQVPPQSTGKKILTEYRKEIYFDNKTGNLFVGDTITGATSLATGIISGIVSEGFAPGSGELYLKDFTGEFADNELIEINNTPVATADVSVSTGGQSDFDIQKVVITDADNPEYNQKIDRFGATVNTFTDGSPTFGPFGTLTVGEPQVIKFYRFAYDNVDILWDTQTVGGGSSVWNPEKTACELSTGTAIGDKVTRTTNYYHPYVPGVGRNLEFTTQFGDNGKTGLRRRLGYFDDTDGAFFEQDGLVNYLVLRSSVSGTVVETRVPQTAWNLDSADGTDEIGLVLDWTKANMLWIDMQWHGAGRVRFGMYEPDGSRVPIHIFKFATLSEQYPYMKTATLPLRFEQENVGSVISPSILRCTSAVVKHTSKVIINGDKWTKNSGVKTISDTDGEVPVMAFRPKQLFNGVVNRSIFKGIDFCTYNFGTEAVIWRIRFDPFGIALTTPTYTSVADASTSEFDNTAAAVNPAFAQGLVEEVCGQGMCKIEHGEDRSLHTFENVLRADGTTQPAVILTAEVIRTGTVDVFACLNWEEFKL